MAIQCLVLGAGQEVGKSCVVVTINKKRIMFDCGMHMGYSDDRRYPQFSMIGKSDGKDFTDSLACVIITHFHLDHIGALPYFTEVCGYNGPVYMTYPTKALGPLMLEDYRKVMVDRRGQEEKFSYEDIVNCMKKVIAVDLKQTIHVDKDLQIRAYYAGHVLGAAMFYAKVGDSAMVYTGDYNMTPDRHLGAAQIDRLQLDLVITESTYATTYRDSKYAREREFLKAVHNCVAGGGKVLIPTFALGRAQELCMLLDDYWERMNLKVPIYFSSGLTIQANLYYKILINWTSQKVKDTCTTRNPFDFKNVCSFDRSFINAPTPCVLFATPGMISGGFSLEVFKQWAPCERNLIMLPGYCVAGTVGHKLTSAKIPTQINLDQDTRIDVRCQIHQLSFSPHTDAKGIMDLVQFLSPKHVILVHGEKPSMATLKEKIRTELKIKCYDPANNETVVIPSTLYIKAGSSDTFLDSALFPNFKFLKASGQDSVSVGSRMRTDLRVCDDRVAEGTLIVHNQNPKIASNSELVDSLGIQKHDIKFATCLPVHFSGSENKDTNSVPSTSGKGSLLHLLSGRLSEEYPELAIDYRGEHLQIESFVAGICSVGSRMRTNLGVCDDRAAEGTLIVQNQNLKIVSNSELVDSLGVQKHDIKFACCLPVHVSGSENKDANSVPSTSGNGSLLHLLSGRLSEEYPELTIDYRGEHLQIESFVVGICLKEQCSHRTTSTFIRLPDISYFCCSWSLADDKLAWKIVSIINNMGI